MERYKGRVTDFCKVFNAMVELPAGALRCMYCNSKTDASCECGENPKKSFGLVARPILIDRNKYVVVAEN